MSIILNQREKGNPCNGTILSLPGRKSSKSLHQQTRLTLLPSGTVKEWFLLMHCWEGDNSDTYIGMVTEHRKHFKRVDLARIQHKTCFRMTVQGHTQVWRLPMPLQNLIEVLPDHPYSPNIAPLGFHVFWALKDVMCGMKFETWCWCDSHIENLTTWGGDIMVMIRPTHTHVSCWC